MFIDRAIIHAKAGNGGDGAVAFHREKYVASGGPDGGDGGHGGNIVFVVDTGLNTLVDFRHKRKYTAQNGQPGGGKRCSGKSGEDCIIKVPKGTLIFDNETGRLMADMSSDEPQILLKGGRGGWGNSHFANSRRQTPRFSKPGVPGEECDLRLELKLLADVGLIGFPSVGKSTLVSVVSEAKPKIADYHFTTLSPVLGVVTVGPDTSFVMADIPGLIEGAGEGVGLGHDFLRHVERCRLLVHIVDVSGSEGRDPIEDFDVINKELKTFNEELASLPLIVAGNKVDLANDDQQEIFAKEMEKRGYEYYPMMAAISHGTEELMQACARKLQTLPPIKEYEPEPVVISEEELAHGHKIDVYEQEGVFFVESPWLLNIMRDINFSDDDGLMYFERVLKSAGVIEALREAGISEGDTVSIYDFEFEFIN